MGAATGPHPGATAEKAVPFPSAGLSIQIAACALCSPYRRGCMESPHAAAFRDRANNPGTVCRDRPAQSSLTGNRSKFGNAPAGNTRLRHRRSCDSSDRAGRSQDHSLEEEDRNRDHNPEEAGRSQGQGRNQDRCAGLMWYRLRS
jgi:hypothetical protein